MSDNATTEPSVSALSRLGADPIGVRSAALAFGGYCLLGALFFWPVLTRLDTHILSSDAIVNPKQMGKCDSYIYLWLYWWFQKALSTGQGVIHCDWVFPLTGANLTFRSAPYLPQALTYPLGRAFGAVAGYNLMVVLLVISAAWAYFLFLARVFRFSPFTSFVVGAFFGFSPYFLWKAHVHNNMLGACFWVGALGALTAAYRQSDFSWKRGFLLALFVWAVFWASLVEFFMLGVTLTLSVLVHESAAWIQGDRKIVRRMKLFLPLTLGAFSLLLLRNATENQTVEMPLYQTILTLPKIFEPARLSIFTKYWGSVKPLHVGVSVLTISAAILGLIGLAVAIRKREYRAYVPAFVIAALLLCLTLDPFHIPSSIIRSLPMGKGFRVFPRFFPFFLAFFLLFSARGLEWLWAKRPADEKQNPAETDTTKSPFSLFLRSRDRRILAIILLAAAAFEMYPAGMNVSPVKQIAMNPETRERLRDGRFCLVVPARTLLQVHESYQIALDAPCVSLFYWDKMDHAKREYRERDFPSVFMNRHKVYPEKPDYRAKGFMEELKILNVGYILFENKKELGRFPFQGETLAETEDEILIEIQHGATNEKGKESSLPLK